MARDHDYSLTPLQLAAADALGQSPQEFLFRMQRHAEREAAISWLVRLTKLTREDVLRHLTAYADEEKSA